MGDDRIIILQIKTSSFIITYLWKKFQRESIFHCYLNKIFCMFQQASSNSFYSSQRVSNYPVKIKGSIGQGSLACTMIAEDFTISFINKNIIVSLVLIEASYIDNSMAISTSTLEKFGILSSICFSRGTSSCFNFRIIFFLAKAKLALKKVNQSNLSLQPQPHGQIQNP